MSPPEGPAGGSCSWRKAHGELDRSTGETSEVLYTLDYVRPVRKECEGLSRNKSTHSLNISLAEIAWHENIKSSTSPSYLLIRLSLVFYTCTCYFVPFLMKTTKHCFMLTNINQNECLILAGHTSGDQFTRRRPFCVLYLQYGRVPHHTKNKHRNDDYRVQDTHTFVGTTKRCSGRGCTRAPAALSPALSRWSLRRPGTLSSSPPRPCLVQHS